MTSGASIVPLDESTDESSSSSLGFPKDGVKLSYIREFYDACGGREKLEGLSTIQVNDLFQKPMTASSKLSFCEYLKNTNHPAVGIATVFISHAWLYTFLDVVDALEHHFRDTPDIVVWFDVFSNNQHRAGELDFEWWATTFKSAIQDFGHTVMVLAPWQDPVPLTRGWCLFELYCTILTKSKFEVAMSQNNRAQFLDELSSESLNGMLATVDVLKSKCSKEEDRHNIFRIVESEVGFAQVNTLIFETMRAWMTTTVELSLKDNASNFVLLNKLADLHHSQGKYDRAETLFVE